MTDVQVSNARRIGFTALALMAFVLSTFQVYWVNVEYFYSHINTDSRGESPLQATGVLIVTAAILPTIFLSFSTSNTPTELRSRRVLSALFAFAACAVFSGGWLAYHDAHVVLFSSPRDRFDLSLISIRQMQQILRAEHEVSWPWLLLPIIVTTAFVIWGAWRRAAQIAMLEPVDEDE